MLSYLLLSLIRGIVNYGSGDLSVRRLIDEFFRRFKGCFEFYRSVNIKDPFDSVCANGSLTTLESRLEKEKPVSTDSFFTSVPCDSCNYSQTDSDNL